MPQLGCRINPALQVNESVRKRSKRPFGERGRAGVFQKRQSTPHPGPFPVHERARRQARLLDGEGGT